MTMTDLGMEVAQRPDARNTESSNDGVGNRGPSGGVPRGKAGDDGGKGRQGRAKRLFRGARFHWPLWPVLLATAALYLTNLTASGWANSFYSAAAQAGASNFEAFIFGSSDAANAITVDKPPASIWLMALSVRLFGLSSMSILLPEVLLGVATVAIVYFSVGKLTGRAAGALAGVILALTPVAALIFRFNNPDALLVFLISLAAWTLLKAVGSGRWRWVIVTGALLGFGFLTKQLQVLLVFPGFFLAFALYACTPVLRRIGQVVAMVAAAVVAAGWWVLLVELTPTSQRPYIGGSQTNSFWELTFGYNGIGRLDGVQVGSVGGGTGGWGETGIGRLFSSSFGGQISWLLPAALLCILSLVVLLVRARTFQSFRAGNQTTARKVGVRNVRHRLLKATLIVWGGWLLVTAVVFSFMAGIIHEYYSVALAPALAVVVAVGAALMWRHRADALNSGMLAGVIALTALWSYALLLRTPSYLPWLKWLILTAGVFAAVGVVAHAALGTVLRRCVLVLAIAASLAGPAAYTAETIATAHTGSIVTAGPSSRGGFGGGPGGMGAPGMSNQETGNNSGNQGFGGDGTGGGQRMGGMNGLLNSSTPSAEVVEKLTSNASSYRWAAATVGSNNASGYQLATELPVMAIGGFNGTDPAPTLDQFKVLVAQGQIHYFIASGLSGSSTSGSDDAAKIAQWVESTYSATTIGSVTLYDLNNSQR